MPYRHQNFKVGTGRILRPTYRIGSVRVDKMLRFITEFNGTEIVRIAMTDKPYKDMYGCDLEITVNGYYPDVPVEMKDEWESKTFETLDEKLKKNWE